jgi:hypothetical protein
MTAASTQGRRATVEGWIERGEPCAPRRAGLPPGAGTRG